MNSKERTSSMPELSSDLTRQALTGPARGLVIVTPSYAQDLALFGNLHRSVLRYFDDSVMHVVVVPQRDVAEFKRFQGARCEVLAVGDLLSRNIRGIPGVNGWVNTRAPFPPLRGWIVQQLVKLSAAFHVGCDAMLVVDSDVEFVAPAGLSTYTTGGVVDFYKAPDAVDDRLPRHMIWVREAHELLGLPLGAPPYPDFVNSPNVLDRRLVVAALRRVEQVTGSPWQTALGRLLHVSEFMVYGSFVDALTRGLHPAHISRIPCHSYFDERPLGIREAESFMAARRPEDVAVMLSAKSGTPMDVRRHIFSQSTGLIAAPAALG